MGVSSTRVGDHRGSARTVQYLSKNHMMVSGLRSARSGALPHLAVFAAESPVCLPSLSSLLSLPSLDHFNVCGDGRPCQLPQQSHAPVRPRRHDVPRCSRSHHTLAVARAPPVFVNAMIHQQQCCASVAHRAPTPRLAQLRPRSLCARSRPRRLVQTDNFFSGPTVSTVSEGLLFVP